MNKNHIDKIKSSAEVIFTSKEIEEGLNKVASDINNDYQDKSPLVLCVVLGGITVFGHLITKLKINLEIDYIHATRYDGDVSGAEIKWKALPKTPLKNRDIIIVDDILDGGLTLKALHNYCYKQQATSVKSMILIDKINARHENGQKSAKYTALKTNSNGYLFGFGMDYYNYLRNINGIFAANPNEMMNYKKNTKDLIV